MPGRPRRACDNCNSQKLRCSSQRPACDRCIRHNRPCIYTPTKRASSNAFARPLPNQNGFNLASLPELLAAFPAPVRTPAAEQVTAQMTAQVTAPATVSPTAQAPSQASFPGTIPETALASPEASVLGKAPATVPQPMFLMHLQVKERSVYGIPPHLLPPLVDLYFTHIYNSNLLFHRGSLLASIDAETLRKDIVLSICALASKFYVDPNGNSLLIENGLCEQWAKEAGQLAFMQVETPSYENIAVFLNLSLFWYSFGQFQKSGVHSACASNTTWLLGLPPNVSDRENTLELEIRRRRFWGCYLFCGFLSASPFPKIPTEEMLDASLPCSEGEFALGRPHALISLKSGQSTSSIYAELVRAIAMWSAVSKAIKEPDVSFNTRLNDIQILDGRIHEDRSRLCEFFPLECESMSMVPGRDLQRLLLVHIIYRQCLCSLHSSIVPLFSWTPCDDALAYPQQLSAQTAYENANCVSMLLETALALDWDSRKLPSFIGYAAYCACAIQIPFVWCSRAEVRQLAVRGIIANLRALQILGSQWMFLKFLGKFAFALYRVHESQPFPLSDEPKGMPPDTLQGFKPGGPKAQLSMLGRSSNISSTRGSMSAGTDEMGDLGLNGAEASGQDGSLTSGQDLTGLTMQMSGQMRHVEGQLEVPTMTDALFNAADSELLGMDGNMGASFSVEVPATMGQAGYIDDWISELINQEFE